MSFNEIKKENNVTFGNNAPVAIKGKGIVFLKEKVKYGNVLFIDGLKHNLLSVSQMCDHEHEVVFSSKNCVVRNIDTSKVIIKGKRTPSNIYVLEGGLEHCYLRKSKES